MGFRNFKSRNYIDLLNLPKDFNDYVKNALPASADWEIPIDGANMLEYLKRFFEGHGGNSLLSKLNALRQTFNIAYTNISIKANTFDEVWQELLLPHGKPEWEELISRWQNYYPFFEYLPFYHTMKEIDKIFSEISEYFSCEIPEKKIFFEKHFNEKLDKVHEKLISIDKLYVRPELYHEEKNTPDR